VGSLGLDAIFEMGSIAHIVFGLLFL
jgi:hypothetical protein